MKLPVCLLVTFLFSVGIVFSQPQLVIDSLTKSLETDITGKEEVDVYVRLAEIYRNNDSTKAVNYANKAIKLAKNEDYLEGKIDAQLQVAILNAILGNYPKARELFKNVIDEAEAANYKKGKLLGLNGLGNISKFQGNLGEALKYLHQSFNIAEEMDDIRGMEISLNNIGLIYKTQGAYVRALACFFQCLELLEELENDRFKASVYNNVGIIYRNQENYEQALEYFFKGQEILEKSNDIRGIGANYNNIGVTYEKLGNYEKALTYFLDALNVFEGFNSKRDIVVSYLSIGNTYKTLGDYDKALDYGFMALNLNEKIGAKDNLSPVLLLLGEVHRKQQNLTLSQKYLTDALTSAKEVGNTQLIKDVALAYSETEKELGNYQKAYDAQLLYQEMKDSLQNQELIREVTRLESQFEFKQEKDSIEFINQAERMVLEKEIEYQKKIQLVTFIAIGLLITLLLILFRFFQSKNTSNRLLLKQAEELKNANAAILSQKEELRELNSMKAKVFSIIAHDLRNPFNTLQGLLGLFKINKGLKQAELKEYIDRISDNLKGLSELLSNLLFWGKSQMQGELQLSPKKLNVQQYIKEAVSLFKEFSIEKGIQTTISIEEKLPAAYADPEIIRFLLRNFLNNAYKYSPVEHGLVAIKATQENNSQVKITVIDNGVGIDEAIQEILFNDFVISQQGTQSEKGTGLGLMLCKDFVEKSGGSIGVESEFEGGSAFWFTLPVLNGS